MRQDRSTPITETAEEPTGCGPDGYGGFAHHHRSVLDHRRSRLTSAEQAWVRRLVLQCLCRMTRSSANVRLQMAPCPSPF